MAHRGGPAGLPTRKETRRLRRELGLDELEDDVGEALHRRTKSLVRVIAKRIHDYLEASPRHHRARRRRQFVHAVESAVYTFVDVVRGAPVSTELRDAFVALGRGEARADDSLLVVHAGFDMATHEACSAMVESSEAMTARSATVLRSAIVSYMAWLMRAVESGYRAERRRLATDPDHLRRQLFDAIIAGGRPRLVEETAAAIEWQVRDRVVVCCADLQAAQPTGGQLHPDALLNVERQRLVALVPEEAAAIVRDGLVSWPRRSPVAVTWAVSLTDVGSAVRSASRVLDLAADGLVPPSDTLDCADYGFAVLLRSDPVALRHLRATVLQPMATLSAREQLALAQTIVRWLPSHDEFKSIAKDLDVHPNTVGNRIRKIREIFGPRITSDPGYATSVLVALAAGGPPCESEHIRRELSYA